MATKSRVLTSNEVNILLKFCHVSSFHEDTLLGVTLALQYYGLLRIYDVLKIEVRDVSCMDDGKMKIKFEHCRKRKNPGFTFYIPLDYKQLFMKYISELDMNINKNTRFLKNYAMLEHKRTIQTGYKKVSNMIKKACAILGKNPKGYTGHCMRRSAATNLADHSVSFVNLKRHGQWKSDSVVEGYIANSEPICMERLEGLMPKKTKPVRNPSTKVYNPYKKIRSTPQPKFNCLTQDLKPSSESDDEDCMKLLQSGPVFEKKKKLVVWQQKVSKLGVRHLQVIKQVLKRHNI